MKVKNVLIVDTETTGIDPREHTVIEIGAVLYSIEHATTLMQVSALYPAKSNEAEAINCIPEAVVKDIHRLYSGELVDNFLAAMIQRADCFIAHKASFDQGFLTALDPILWSERPWTCSKEIMKFEKGRPGDSLVNLALAHGVGVSSAHRALTDCQLLARIFDSYGPKKLQAMFADALLPRARWVAVTSYDEREKAKTAGFMWDPDKKYWHKLLTDEEAAAITEFRVRKA